MHDKEGRSAPSTGPTDGGGGTDGRRERRWGDLRLALAGGGLGALCMFAGIATVGTVGAQEARSLLETVRPTLQFLSSGVLAAGATVLALMLTLLGITFSLDMVFSTTHFQRIKTISTLASVSIILAVGLLLFLLLPVAGEEGSTLYNSIVYYVLIAVGSVLGGTLAAVVLMLQRTIGGMAEIAHPEVDTDSELLAD